MSENILQKCGICMQLNPSIPSQNTKPFKTSEQSLFLVIIHLLSGQHYEHRHVRVQACGSMSYIMNQLVVEMSYKHSFHFKHVSVTDLLRMQSVVAGFVVLY